MIGAIVRCSGVVAMVGGYLRTLGWRRLRECGGWRPLRGRSRPSRSLRFMHVRVRLFAILRDRAGGSNQLELELPEGAVVADALEQMRPLTDGVPVVMAINHEYVEPRAPLH